MTDFNNAIDKLIVAIGDDYHAWSMQADMEASRVETFREELSVKTGRKYVKILSRSSVWGFVQIEDDKMFKRGDILMAAGYNAPARNKARGNIFDPNYDIAWTGPRYLF